MGRYTKIIKNVDKMTVYRPNANCCMLYFTCFYGNKYIQGRSKRRSGGTVSMHSVPKTVHMSPSPQLDPPMVLKWTWFFRAEVDLFSKVPYAYSTS